jgi:hypothetical protein
MTNLAKELCNGTANVVQMSGEVFNDLVNVVLSTVNGVVDSVNTVTRTTGDVVDKVVGDTIGVKTTQIFKNVGSAAKDVSDSLGRIVQVIPLVGGPVAYVVKRTGDGVYHVIVSVGNIAGSSAKKVGEITKKSSDLIVFTLAAGQKEINNVVNAITELVTTLTRAPNSKKAHGGAYRRRMGGRRRQGRRTAKSRRNKSGQRSRRNKSGQRSRTNKRW